MPKFSRFRPRRRTYKKYGFKKRLRTMVSKQISNQMQVKQWAPTTISANDLHSTGDFWSISTAIVQGSGDDNRIGDQIRPVYLEINSFFFTLNTMAAGQNVLIRAVWVRDSMADGNYADITDLFEHSGDPLSPYNQVHQLNRPKRFQILSDRTINLVTGTERSSKATRQRINLRRATPIKYLSNSGTVASAGKGSIFLILLSNTLTNGVSYNIDYRLGFTDA